MAILRRCRGSCSTRKARTNTDATPKTVSAFLDEYMERCVKPAGLRSLPSVQSRGWC